MLRRLAGRVLTGLFAFVGIVGIISLLVLVRRALRNDSGSLTAPSFVIDTAATDSAPRFVLPDTLLGRSRTLRFVAVSASEGQDLPGFLDAYGDSILIGPRTLVMQANGHPFTLFVITVLVNAGARLLIWRVARGSGAGSRAL